jgi:glycosyltransferase involved in cell wall biosynthesis
VSTRATLVIPCFNEEQRLDRAGFASLLAEPQLDLTFVDDGSTDGTSGVLRGLAEAHPGRVDWLRLERNAGKA